MGLPQEKEFESIVVEIQSLRVQWEAEVGQGRRAWPKAIKERVLGLTLNSGKGAREISALTGISYETINQWKHQFKKGAMKAPGFHQLVVESSNKSATVTVAEPPPMQPLQSTGKIRVKTPKGYVFEGLSYGEFLELIKSLGGLRVF